jgi:hypothetical protein
MIATSTSTTRLTFRATCCAYNATNIDASGVGSIVLLVKDQNLSDRKAGDTLQCDYSSALRVAGSPIGQMVGTTTPIVVAGNADQ